MKEELQKRAKKCGYLFFLFWVAIYFVEKAGEIIVDTGGTTESIAKYLIALKVIFLFAIVFYGIRYLMLRSQIRKLPLQ